METFSALLAICAGNSPATGEFSTQRPVTRSFDVFFDIRLNEWWSKQSWGWWFETPSHPLWCHSYVIPGLHCNDQYMCFQTGDFGPAGSLLMMVDDSEKHTLSIWEWQSECMVAKTPVRPSSPIVMSHKSRGVSAHWQFDYLFNSLFRVTARKTPKVPHYWPFVHR